MSPDRAGSDRMVLPDGCLDIVWNGSELFVAGPDTGPMPVGLDPGASFAGVRFAMGAAAAFLSIDASEIRDQRVSLAAFWGDHAVTSMAARLEAAPCAGLAARALEQIVVRRLPELVPLDPVVVGLVATLRRRPESALLGRLADELGTTGRSMHRACSAAVGYGPKTLQRVLRFRRFLALAETRPAAGLARLAAEAGYADQPHLTRECARLAGTTPARILVARRRNVQDSRRVDLPR
ncbi:MAG: helix-turn-helix domain-containing protein [Actinomycetota bacterium]|nr:helix-turn-helix domain-containing protein [Actinomycetota bacterium]